MKLPYNESDQALAHLSQLSELRLFTSPAN